MHRRSWLNRNLVIYVVLVSMCATIVPQLVYAMSYIVRHAG